MPTKTKTKRGKKDRWIAPNESFASLMTEAKKLAEERHGHLIRKETQKPSRAITVRQKNGKRCAEICRLKMRIYTELLEKKLAAVHSANEREQRILALQSTELSLLRARIAEFPNNRLNRIQQTNRNETSAFNPPHSHSCMSDTTLDSGVYDGHAKSHQLQQCGEIQQVEGIDTTDDDSWFLLYNDFPRLDPSLDIAWVTTPQGGQTVPSANCDRHMELATGCVNDVQKQSDPNTNIIPGQEQQEEHCPLCAFEALPSCMEQQSLNQILLDG